MIKVEKEKPPLSLFKELGYDPEPGAGVKHYRRFYPEELENVKINDGKLFTSPFLTEEIYRAVPTKQGGLFGGLFGGDGG